MPMSIDRRHFLLSGAALAGGVALPARAGIPALLPASAAALPRWRGFNLLEKYTRQNNRPYRERDFDFIAAHGFNFIRLPLDYRIWTRDDGTIDDAPLRDIDQALAWARARGIHLCLCLHRAPGYCINPPKEPLDLWADGTDGDQARLAFAAQWRLLANRYRGVPPAALSFDLVNEPMEVTGAAYLKVATAAVTAIRAEDPERLIIADGTGGGRNPVPDLVALGIAQAGRGYEPFTLTHYRAEWVTGAAHWPEPVWPVRQALNAYFHGPAHPDLQEPLRVDLPAPGPWILRFQVEEVAGPAHLVISANGVAVLTHRFDPVADVPASTRVETKTGRVIGRYDQSLTVTLAQGPVSISLEAGDWLTFSSLSLQGPTARATTLLRPSQREWGGRQADLRVRADGSVQILAGGVDIDRTTLWRQQIIPWQTLQGQGAGVMVGEWGAYRFTPHPVVLAWMADVLDNWRRAGWGWALWNLRGDFGPLDSRRNDVRYETRHGYQIDRAMLDLLREPD